MEVVEGTASQTDQGTGNGIAGTGEVQKPTWIEQLPEDMRGDKSLYGYQKIGDLVKAHKDSLSARESLIKVPGEGATEEERAAFLKAIGRPESPDKYTLDDPEYPEGLQYEPKTREQFQAMFHELGIPNNAAKTLWEKYHQAAIEGHKARLATEKQATEQAINKLKDEWKGETFKVNTELAHRAFMRTFNGDEAKTAEAKAFIEETKVNGLALGDHPMFIRIFSEIGKTISDDSATGDRGGIPGEMSDEEKARRRFPNTWK